jgi:mannose-6-phosphate isomerase-like protein (cupin superfamily)
MAKRNSTIEQLNDAIEAMMVDPEPPRPSPDARLTELLRIAADLRDLPNSAFKARLKAELLSAARDAAAVSVPAHYGKVLLTAADYIARIGELAQQQPLLPYDLDTALRGLPDLGSRFLTPLNNCAIGVSRFSSGGHWERHMGSDELLYFLHGEAEVVTLTEDGPVHAPVHAGSIFICPEGLWHRVTPRSTVSMLFATPTATEGSATQPPLPAPRRRVQRSGSRARSSRTGMASRLVAHDLDLALTDLPELAITPNTTEAEADAAVRVLTSLGPYTLGLMRFSGQTPWERHPEGDELLHVLDGTIDLTVLTDTGPTGVTLDRGSVFVCPKGLWHRQRPREFATLLFSTPTETSEASFADDPRHA